MLCLVFEDSAGFPKNRAELYKNGVDVLLKKWDAKRNIERDHIYKKLSLKRKEDLLSQIAFTTFDAGTYFIKEREIKKYISQYIQNLSNVGDNLNTLDLDSATVLKSIEAQHGLLIERARDIYSFSHLTFHEYFVARKIYTSCNQYDIHDPKLVALVKQITDKRWREIFLILTSMLDSADVLIELIKHRADYLLVKDRKLQSFLEWLNEKARMVKSPCKAAAVRAFYFNECLAFDDCDLLSEAIDKKIVKNLEHDMRIADDDIFRSIKDISDPEIFLDFSLSVGALDAAINVTSDPDLIRELRELESQRPDDGDEELYESWCEANYELWQKKLELISLKFRNLRNDWNFNGDQKKMLRRYYDSNLLLMNCINQDCYVSRDVRQEIEDTLLLPSAEIEKRKQQ
jgi:predicted NACHT family NTPase